MSLAGGARLEDIFAMVQRGEVATLNLVLKADVQGSLEALTDSLRKLDQEHEEVRLSFVHRAVGGINESDINLASVSNATVIGFNVRPDRKARELATLEGVEMRLYEVIYQVLEDVQSALLGMLKPEFEEVVTGEAEVREVFSVPRVGKVAGCYVRNGTITRGSKVRFLREGVVIWNGAIASLRRFKDDVREVQSGLRVRHRARELPGPQVGRRHRDLRPQGDRTRVAPRPRPECRLSGPRSARARPPVACAALRRPRKAAVVRRAAVLVLLLSLSSALAALGVAAPMAGAANGPLAAVTVTGAAAAKPTVTFDTPFTVKKTTNQVVTAGTGAALTKGQTITFDYVLVDGRSGKELETSFGNTPGSLTLDPSKTATQLVTSLTGKTVGSRLLVAIAPKDGLAKRLNNPAVKKTDTLLFVIDVKTVRKPLARATGAPVAPVAGLPTVSLAANGKPTITVPAGVAAPTQLVTQALIKGAGPAVTAGQTITVQYTSVKWDGKLFDSTWDRAQPIDTPIGTGTVIPAWDEGLVGQTVGSQVLLVVPPDKGYGTSGSSDGKVKGTDTLVFVIDILDAY